MNVSQVLARVVDLLSGAALIATFGGATLLTTVVPGVRAAQGTAAPLGDTAGIPVVTSIDQGAPTSDAQTQAFSDAWVYGLDHPDEVGYPWIDPETNKIILSAASATGAEALEKWAATLPVATSIRSVEFSFGELEAIKHESISLRSEGVPGADLILMTAPDERSNRVVITVSAPSAELSLELGRRYGTKAIALRLETSEKLANSPMSRDFDFSPFYGGARIYVGSVNKYCSDSFSWKLSGIYGNALLTAAHCVYMGGTVRIGDTGSPIAGSVQSGNEENWTHGVGTVYYTGQNIYAGDVALIRLNSGLRSNPYIYRDPNGAPSPVVSGGLAYMARDDKISVGGQMSDETGLYKVGDQHVDVWYSLTNETVRNVSIAGGIGIPHPCPQLGDSGGSVFKIVSGGVKAAGTYSGAYVNACDVVYTELYDTFLRLPGVLLVQ